MSETLECTHERAVQRVIRLCKGRGKGFFVRREVGDGFDDPLAVHIGLGVGAQDIPADGWSETFDKDVAMRILGYLEDIHE